MKCIPNGNSIFYRTFHHSVVKSFSSFHCRFRYLINTTMTAIPVEVIEGKSLLKYLSVDVLSMTCILHETPGLFFQVGTTKPNRTH